MKKLRNFLPGTAALAILILSALFGHAAAAGTFQPAAVTEQTYGYHPWTIWSPGVQPGSFYLDHCRPMLVGDVNGDGRDDLYCETKETVNATVSNVYVQVSQANGATNWQWWGGSFSDLNLLLCQSYLVDFNGDGTDDLVCLFDTESFVRHSTGTQFGAWLRRTEGTGFGVFLPHCNSVHLGDVSRNGLPDYICPIKNTALAKTQTWVMRSYGELFYDFEAWRPLETGVDLDNCRPVLAGDVNGDGRTDLICPYDYGGGSTITFVLRVVVHYLSLPLIMR